MDHSWQIEQRWPERVEGAVGDVVVDSGVVERCKSCPLSVSDRIVSSQKKQTDSSSIELQVDSIQA